MSGYVIRNLEETVPGDVFYVIGKALKVWERVEPSEDGFIPVVVFEFVGMGMDYQYSLDEIGPPETAVVVIHNTKTGKIEP